jgi:hypothetical protein
VGGGKIWEASLSLSSSADIFFLNNAIYTAKIKLLCIKSAAAISRPLE